MSHGSPQKEQKQRYSHVPATLLGHPPVCGHVSWSSVTMETRVISHRYQDDYRRMFSGLLTGQGRVGLRSGSRLCLEGALGGGPGHLAPSVKTYITTGGVQA